MELINGMLKLRYAFTTSPNPIRASATGAEANVITLQVMISNPQTLPVAISAIAVKIPMGENTARALSSATNLPAPTIDPTGNWTFTAAGDTLTIEPVEGASGEVTDTLIITIPGITVNEMPGVVPITIIEAYPSAPRQTDNVTYVLIKHEADFPVTDFWADPALFHDVDKPTTLYWTVSDQGKQYSYGLRSNDWQPRDCLNRGDCFSWQEGAAGIETPPLHGTTSYTLSVIGTDSSGSRVVKKTLEIKVRVIVPSVLEVSRVDRIAIDRFVSMRWVALNATRCTVLLDGEVIDDQAPTNTYRQGYPLILPEGAGTHQLALVAHGESGAQAGHTFPDIKIRATTTLALPGNTRSIAITPDSKLALVANLVSDRGVSEVSVIDIRKRTRESATIPIPSAAQGIAITPDGKQALVSSLGWLFGSGAAHAASAITGEAGLDPELLSALAPMPPRDMSLTPSSLSGAGGPDVVASDAPLSSAPVSGAALTDATDVATGSATAAGTEAGTEAGIAARQEPGHLNAASGGNAVTFIDIPRRAVAATTQLAPAWPTGLAITPNGGHAFVCTVASYDITMIDIPNHSVAATIKTSILGGTSVAITPDGKLALELAPGRIVVIDIATRSVEAKRIMFGRSPAAIAITPDGKLALVMDKDEDLLTVVDIATRTVEPKRIAIGRVPFLAAQTIAITSDGKFALIASANGNVTVLDIAGRKVIPGTITIPKAAGIRITPDGQTTIAIESEGNRVTFL